MAEERAEEALPQNLTLSGDLPYARATAVRTLLVEDDAVVREMLVEALQDRGHDVTTCLNGRTAWELCQRESFEIYVFARELPGVDGIELCRRLRESPIGDSCAILVMTSRAQPDDLMEVLDAGADDYLPKPFDLSLFGMRVALAERSVAVVAAKAWTERDRARLRRRVEADRARADAARARATFLAEASALLATSFDAHATLQRIMDLAVPTLADWCAVDVIAEDGTIERVAAAHVRPESERLMGEIRARYPYARGQRRAIPTVLETGTSWFVAKVTERYLDDIAVDREHRRLLGELGLRSTIVAPLTVRDRTIGALSLKISTNQRQFHRADLALAEDLARRVAQAIDNSWLYAREQQARRDAERAAERIAQLQSVTAALAGALDPAGIARAVVEHGIAVLDARAGSVALVTSDGRALEIVSSSGYDPAAVEPWRQIGLAAPLPLADAARTGVPIWLGSAVELDRRYPGLAAHHPSRGAWVALPLVAGGRTLGAIGLSFASERRFDADERRYAESLAHLSAQALARARLHEDLERATDRLQALARASVAAQAATTEEEVYDAIGAGLTGVGLNFLVATLDSSDDSSALVIRQISTVHRTLAQVETTLGRPLVGERLSYEDVEPLRIAVRERRATLVDDVVQLLDRTFPWVNPAPAEQVAYLAASRCACAAVTDGQEVLGVLAIWGPGLVSRDVAGIDLLGRQAGGALVALRLRAADRQRDRLDGALLLARTAAHEVTNALGLTTGYAELLAEHPLVAADPMLAEYIAEVREGAARAAERVTRLQRLIRLEERSSPLGAHLPVIDVDRSTSDAGDSPLG